MLRGLGICVGLLFVLSLGSAPALGVDLVINEFMTTNDTAVQDEWGDFDDWFEIHNLGTAPVNIEGMHVTDDLVLPTKFVLPDTVIQPGGYVVIWCDNELNEGPLHVGFQLDGDGEQIGLFDTLFNGTAPIDTLTFGQQIPDVSSGRWPNGTGPFVFMGIPTPGADNEAPFNLPPYLTDTEHNPVNPDAEDVVTVTTEIVEDFGLSEAKLFYDAGSGFVDGPLFDDGNHGDGLAGDGEFGGQIPPHPNGTVVDYYVWAVDDSAAEGTDPADAPATTFSYEVGYIPPPLFVNEFLARNNTVNEDEFGDFDDWVEIYNGSAETINMFEMILTDDLGDLEKFTFPDTIIPAGGFLLVWCDGEPHEGPLHADFALAGDGEQIGLYASDVNGNVVIDSLTYGPQSADISFGRRPDGSDNWEFFTEPTPGFSNTDPSDAPELASLLSFRLVGARPNPMRGGTWIAFQIPDSRTVVLRILAADGREVARPVSRILTAGQHAIGWDGLDGSGRPVASGVYLYQLKAGNDVAHGKILQIR
jgi:hypothetical protein